MGTWGTRTGHIARRGTAGDIRKFQMTLAHFTERLQRDDITIAGDEGARALLGFSR